MKEPLSRYEQLCTGEICDVLRELALLDHALPGHLKPLRPERTVAGLAFTVKSTPNVKITGEMTLRTQMLAELPADTMVVWDTSNDEKITLWGVVIDGGIPGTHQISEKDFPVFYKHRIPSGSLERCLITHYQIPIKIGGGGVKPGDVVFGDIDGVVVVPRDIAYEVLVRAEEIKATKRRSSAGSPRAKPSARSPKTAATFSTTP